ncbi:MAG: DUF1929 domain-containing protein [Myxococcales bacterium]|nr:MAG: DUF1929 domain-containing protein [Myxococcales bacterium]
MLESRTEISRRVFTIASSIARGAAARGALLTALSVAACSAQPGAGGTEEWPTAGERAAALEVSPATAALAITLPEAQDPLFAGLSVPADAALRGMWSPTRDWPLNGLHSTLLPNGRVLTYGTPAGNAASQDGRTFDVWDPAQGFTGVSHRTVYNAQQVNSFCSSAAFLRSGTLLVSGGNSPLESSEFSPATAAVVTSPFSLADERWYGSMITLADGRLLMLGGSTPYGALRAYQDPGQAVNAGSVSMTPEIYEPGTGFRSLFGAYSREAFGPDHHRYWYPRAWAAPNGEVFGISSEKMWFLSSEGSGAVRVAGAFKTGVDAVTRPNIGPTSAAVMFAPGRILQVGGNGYHDGHATPSSALATVVDINGAAPVVTETNPMTFARQWPSATVLPDGRVVVTGGTRYANNGGADAVYEAELWEPSTGVWTTGARAGQVRVYHSAAILMPNGAVLSTGGGAPGPVNNLNAEVYYPPYLFRAAAAGGAELAPRPRMAAVSTLALGHGAQLDVQLTGSPTIVQAVLIGASSVTHSFNTFQRRLELRFLQEGGRLAVEMPARAAEAPPGYYALFLLDQLGVPSNAVLLSLGEDMAAPPVSTLLPRGNVITLQSLSQPDYAIATDAQSLGVLKLLGASPSASDLSSARFLVRDGLADSNCVSLESTTTPGQWLRHQAYRLRAAANDGSDVFKADATFCPELGLAGTGISLRSKNFPLRVLRHRSFELWLDPVTTETGFAAEASFKLREPPLPTLPAVPAPIVASGATVHYAPALTLQGASYIWDFGDGSAPSEPSTTPEATHTYGAPGLYLVTLTVRLADGRTVIKTFVQAVRGEVTPGASRSSSALAVEARSGAPERIWVVNPDADTVSVLDSAALTRLKELAVGASPRSVAVAPNGRIWVVARDSATISVVDPSSLTVTQTISLPARSRPYGLVFAPGGSAYVSLDATGQLLQLDAATGERQGALDVGPNARGLAVTADGARLLVSRFVSPPAPGESNGSPTTSQAFAELRAVDLPAMAGSRLIRLHHSDRVDGSVQGRGIPNYLGAASIAPSGLSAWVPSKQDNIARGTFRDGQNLDFQNTVRAVTSRVDLVTESESAEQRVDHDNAGVASAAVFHPSGVYLFVALETSRQVAVVSALTGSELMRVEVGLAPQSLALSSNGARLYVQNFMGRTVSAIDLSPLVESGEFKTSTLATIATVTTEKLGSNVLSGKRLFYDARDPRLARDAYLSCASCHADGDSDGRVWDLTGMGEGLRNTISLVGRSGAQGRLHWSGNFDEVQDFENQIRSLAGGTGLMTDSALLTGTRSQPLGDAKAGLSADLDALAAYVKSLTTPTPSPYRSASGLTAAGAAGRVVFANAGCTSCHFGTTFSSEGSTALEDIGTLRVWSGQRASGPLLGIDVPSLRDVFATAPYLHDGSAKTLADAVAAHRGVALSESDLSSLVEFLRQIDGSEPAVPKIGCTDGVKNGTETGVDCGGTCSACAVCSGKTYEAESMYASTGGSISGGWNIWANGYLSASHAFTAGATTITVLARGSVAASVWPTLRLSVGGAVVGTASVNTTSYAPHAFTFVATSGAKEVKVEFTNDLNQNGQDRNLYVDRVDVSCGSLPPAPTCTDGLKNGTETAVDCGGSCSSKCATGQACSVSGDCATGTCAAGICQAASTAKVTAVLTLGDQWTGGYCANLKVTNASSAAITTWTVTLSTNQSTLTSSWSANFAGSGSTRTVTPVSHNAALSPGASTTVGFCANTTGSNWQPVVLSAK